MKNEPKYDIGDVVAFRTGGCIEVGGIQEIKINKLRAEYQIVTRIVDESDIIGDDEDIIRKDVMRRAESELKHILQVIKNLKG